MGRAVSYGSNISAAVVGATLLLASKPLPSPRLSELDGAGFDRGDPTAPVLVVEFADFGCAACAQFAVSTFRTIDEQLIATGRVRWKLIPFELGVFKRSSEATVAAICAAQQGHFWQFHDSLFANPRRWQSPRKPLSEFRDIAIHVGIDTAGFVQCYESDGARDESKRLRNTARTSGVRGTPTFFMGERKLEGAPPTDEFISLLKQQPY